MEKQARNDKLSDVERERMLAALHRIMKEQPSRPQAEVEAELRENRGNRRWARLHPAEPD